MGFLFFSYANKILVIKTKEQNQDKYHRMELKKFLKKIFFLNDFPARPLSNGVTIVVIAVLEGK